MMIRKNLAKLIDLKSIVTLLMTIFMGVLLFSGRTAPQELVALYASSYGAVMTYYFTRQKEASNGDGK